MSIIILTPPPKGTGSTSTSSPTVEGVLAAPSTSVGQRLESAFLHLIGMEGHRFDTFEQLRDFAQAQIDAAKPAE